MTNFSTTPDPTPKADYDAPITDAMRVMLPDLEAEFRITPEYRKSPVQVPVIPTFQIGPTTSLCFTFGIIGFFMALSNGSNSAGNFGLALVGIAIFVMSMLIFAIGMSVNILRALFVEPTIKPRSHITERDLRKINYERKHGRGPSTSKAPLVWDQRDTYEVHYLNFWLPEEMREIRSEQERDQKRINDRYVAQLAAQEAAEQEAADQASQRLADGNGNVSPDTITPEMQQLQAAIVSEIMSVLKEEGLYEMLAEMAKKEIAQEDASAFEAPVWDWESGEWATPPRQTNANP